MAGQPAATEIDAATQERAARSPLVVVAVAVLAPLVVLAVTWWATRVHDATLATSIATAGIIGAGTAVSLVSRPPSTSTATRWVAIGLTIAACTTIVALSGTGTLATVKARASQAGWQEAVDRVLAEGPERESVEVTSTCFWGPQLKPERRELAGFGRVDSICSSGQPGRRFVHLTQDDPMYPGAGGRRTGLVYAPDTADPQVASMCVQHVDGPWWLTASAGPGCPPGFTFIGGR